MTGRPSVGILVPVLLVATVCGPARSQDALPLETIRLPEGFRIEVFAEDVPNARQMAWSPNGILYVGSRGEGTVHAVVDDDGDHRADRVVLVDSGLEMPSGIVWRDGSLYVAAVSRILRYDGIDEEFGAPSPPDPVVVRDDLPTERHHGWKYLGFGPDGRLYFNVGAPCNICLSEAPVFATISRMHPDGSGLEVFAHGVRNSVGFDWHPETGVLWFTDNGRDRMGDNRPPDELNRAPEAGLHFGYPFCHGGDIPDPEYGDSRACTEFVPPAQRLGPHVAGIGMTFYDGTMFPDEYRHDIFIAEHGSWNRSEKIGYRVTRVDVEDGKAVGYEPFAEGWLQGQDEWGRPADVLVMPDGALLVSDDANGVIYRISYVGDGE